jgi:hypothetical protein
MVSYAFYNITISYVILRYEVRSCAHLDIAISLPKVCLAHVITPARVRNSQYCVYLRQNHDTVPNTISLTDHDIPCHSFSRDNVAPPIYLKSSTVLYMENQYQSLIIAKVLKK